MEEDVLLSLLKGHVRKCRRNFEIQMLNQPVFFIAIANALSYLAQRGRRAPVSSSQTAADLNEQMVLICKDVRMVYRGKECGWYVQAQRLANDCSMVSVCQSPLDGKFGGWVTPVAVDIKYEFLKQAQLISSLEM